MHVVYSVPFYTAALQCDVLQSSVRCDHYSILRATAIMHNIYAALVIQRLTVHTCFMLMTLLCRLLGSSLVTSRQLHLLTLQATGAHTSMSRAKQHYYKTAAYRILKQHCSGLIVHYDLFIDATNTCHCCSAVQQCSHTALC
jgi:hypothetical protein